MRLEPSSPSDFSRATADAETVRPPRLPEPLLTRRRAALERTLAATATPARRVERLRPDVRRKLIERATLGWTVAEQEEIERLGYDAYLERQLHPETIDDFGLEETLDKSYPSLAMSPGERLRTYHRTTQVPNMQFTFAAILRAMHSPRQLYERLVVFWTDHFNVNLFSDRGFWLKPTDDREVIRRHAMGTFPELLRASAHSAAMLDYLTNATNVVGHPNENYARELMELHTLGVDGGFTEDDVREVARALTGWTFHDYDAGPLFGRFRFDAANHDDGAKVVLGHVLPAGGGIADGETVLEILANHPSTARHVATKLLRYFWGYEPRDKAVSWIARIYLETGGDVRSMVGAILAERRMRDATPKLKRPFHLMISAARALSAETENLFSVVASMSDAGQLPFAWGPPNGYPDSEPYWSGFVLPRWNFASEVPTPRSGLAIDPPFTDPMLPPAQVVEILDQLLLAGTASTATRDAVTRFLESLPPGPARLRDALGLFIAAPEFQRY